MTHCFLFSFLDDVEHNLTYGIWVGVWNPAGCRLLYG